MEVNPSVRPSLRPERRKQNSFLKSILIFTILISFTVLLVGGYWIFKEMAPRPKEVRSESGDVLMTKETIIGGQSVFQKYGLMDYGTVLGHGSYMGPDYTAEALKIYTEGMQEYKAKELYGKSFSQLSKDEKTIIRDKVIKEIRKNRYNPVTDVLVLTDAQVYGLQKVRDYYRDVFTNGDGWGLQKGLIKESDMPKTNRA